MLYCKSCKTIQANGYVQCNHCGGEMSEADDKFKAAYIKKGYRDEDSVSDAIADLRAAISAAEQNEERARERERQAQIERQRVERERQAEAERQRAEAKARAELQRQMAEAEEQRRRADAQARAEAELQRQRAQARAEAQAREAAMRAEAERQAALEAERERERAQRYTNEVHTPVVTGDEPTGNIVGSSQNEGYNQGDTRISLPDRKALSPIPVTGNTYTQTVQPQIQDRRRKFYWSDLPWRPILIIAAIIILGVVIYFNRVVIVQTIYALINFLFNIAIAVVILYLIYRWLTRRRRW